MPSVAPNDNVKQLETDVLKDCIQGTIATVKFLSQQMGCFGFNLSVHIVRLQKQN